MFCYAHINHPVSNEILLKPVKVLNREEQEATKLNHELIVILTPRFAVAKRKRYFTRKQIYGSKTIIKKGKGEFN